MKLTNDSARLPEFGRVALASARMQHDRPIFLERIREIYRSLTGVNLPQEYISRIDRIAYRDLLELIVELDYADRNRLPIGGADRIIKGVITLQDRRRRDLLQDA